ncbi:hypothetical protein [Actinomadura sp. NEAU-AAG7]|uniref:hypothetical protein n=1 Tax=Actinomadura sp. NEAU-AAG7 TaxID=2839640 RepID=UPI0035B25A87
MLGALGLMINGPDSAELAHWVRPESRRRGLALRDINTLTRWTHNELGINRIWLRPTRQLPLAEPGRSSRVPIRRTYAPPLPYLDHVRPGRRHLA